MPSSAETGDAPNRRIRCGLALEEKKFNRYATDKVKRLAGKAGVDIVRIDINAPLHSQGDFSFILHKLVPSHSFYTQLEEYSRVNRNCRIVDEPRRVRSIQSRGDMLSVFSQPIETRKPGHAAVRQGASESGDSSIILGGTSDESLDGMSEEESLPCRRTPGLCTYSSPKQIIVPPSTSYSEMTEQLENAGLQYPIISKPLASDGTEGSHGITLLLEDSALQILVGESSTTETGFVLQQYHQHGEVLYKVYVLGDSVEVMLRPSLKLPSISHMRTNSSSGYIVLPRFSTMPPSDPLCHASGHDPFPHHQGSVEGQLESDILHSPTTEDCLATMFPVPEGGLDTSPSEAQSPRRHREITRSIARERPRAFTESGRAMISWTARTGSGRNMDFSVIDPRDAGGDEPRHSLDEVTSRTPPEWSLRQMAEQLRKRLGLTIFNMDILCPTAQDQPGSLQYFVVDINYFPGFDKLHRFEEKFAKFLVSCGKEAAADP